MNGNALHLLRLAAGLSLEDLGELTGIRLEKLARWEAESPPRVGSDTYSRLADALEGKLHMPRSQIVDALLFGRVPYNDDLDFTHGRARGEGVSSTLKPLPTDGGDALSKKIKAANWWFDQVYIPKRAKKRVSLFDYARAFQEALRAGGAYPADLQAPLGTEPEGFEEVMRRVSELIVAFGYEDREVESDVGQRFVEYLYRAIEWEGCGDA